MVNTGYIKVKNVSEKNKMVFIQTVVVCQVSNFNSTVIGLNYEQFTLHLNPLIQSL